MGCDIHAFPEQRIEGKWAHVKVKLDGSFMWRNYNAFAFLAGVRNRSDIAPISEPRGIPVDASNEVRELAEDENFHSHSWLSISELESYDYEKRVVEFGVEIALREFLGNGFFEDLKRMKAADVERVVFAFDN